MTVAATITAVKIHDGDPAVLAALCEQRGAAALAYCEEVASPGEALAAAADAFASFRAAIVAPQELKGRQAEALLRNMIRRSAMARSINALAAEPPSEDCADPETELLGYVNDALSPEQRERVAAHVAQCWSCATALQRLQAGERAFTQATRSSLSPGLSAVLLEAMVTAAPIRVQGEDAESVLAEGLRLLGVDGDGAAEPAAPPAATASDEPPPADATPPPAVERVRVSDPEDFDDEPQGVLTRGYPRRDPVRAADAAAGAEAERGDLRSRMASAAGRFSGRLPSRERRRGDTPLRHTRSAALLRGAGKLLVVVALAGSGGALLGLGLAELAGGDATSTPALTQTETSTSGAPARDRTSTATTPRTTTTSAETTTTPASTSTGGG